MSEPRASMVDVAFALLGQTLPRDHRRAIAEALQPLLPWLAATPGAGVHGIRVSAGQEPRLMLSKRSRLTLRVPRERIAALDVLVGAELDLGGQHLRLAGPATVRELLPFGTLYAHAVATDSSDELAFLDRVDTELAALGVSGRRICGRLQPLADGLLGYGLMLDHLSPADALRLLEAGLGAHRLWGCGIFVPHRSAAAVGS